MKNLKKVAPIGCFIIFFMCLFIPFIPIINNSSLYDENFIIDNQNPLDPPVEQEISIKEVLQQNLNNISGTGDALSGEKFCQIQGNELDKLGNSSFSTSINDWNATSINVNISNLRYNFTTMGDDIQDKEEKLTDDQYYAHPFQIQGENCSLRTVSVKLFVVLCGTSGNDFAIAIYNATDVGGLQPDEQIDIKDIDIADGNVVDYLTWYQVEYSNLELLSSNTAQNTFYIALICYGSQTDIRWRGTDTQDNFACFISDGTWTSFDFDFACSTNITTYALPSEVNVTLNGTAFSNIASGEGKCNYIFPTSKNETLNYNVLMNKSCNYDLTWELNLLKSQTFNTSYFVSSELNYSKWNATANVEFFLNSYNKFINLSLPNWNFENVSLNGVNHSDAYLYNEPFGQILTLFNAQNGTWNVICNSSNFLTNVSVIRNDIFVDLVNATDIVNISCNFSSIINTGLANATIYPLYDANYSTSKSVSGSNSLVFDEWDINQTLIQNIINYTVQVFWYNGTEVGLNKTKLDILSLASNISLIYNSTDVNAGEYAYAYFNFTDNETDNTILNAEYELRNSTDGSIWTKSYTSSYYSNGTYRIRLSTVGLGSAIYHNVTIFVWGRVHDNSTLNITFRIYGGATNVSILSGLVEEGIYQVITSNLYVNATVSFRIHYQTNDSAYPIEDAFVEAEDWVGVPLTYSDLGGGDYEVFIHSTNLHVNNYTMTFIIQAIGYDSAKLQIKVPVLEIPTQIDVPPEYQNLEKYSDEQFDVIIIYYDSYHYESIEDAVPEDGGNVTYQLLSNNETMDRITSLAGLYKATIKLSEISGIQENTYYNISIAAKAIDFQLAQANISIFIKPKINTSLNLINPPIQVLAGNELKLHANLTLQDGTPIPNVIVTFQINYSQSGISEKVEYTNQSGIATVEITPEKINDNFTILLMYSGNISYNEVNSSNYFIDIIILASNICLLVPSEIMAGDEFEICANLTLVDGTPIKNELVIFAVTSNPGGTINYQVYTNGSGIAILDISTYQGLDNLSIQVLYEGNETINAVNSLVENVMVIFYQSILSVDVINEILEGQTLEIIIYLKFLANNSPIIGEQVQCNLVFGGLGTSNIYYGTISPDGYALIRVLVPIGARSISINVTYSGKSHISTATLPTIIQVNVITILDIIIRYSPIWIPLIIAAIAIPLTIKYGIMRPRYKKKLSKWKLTESKFTDLANLEFLLVNIRENGLNIFNYSFQGSEINFELLGGFFTAITMFQRELMLDDKKDVQKSDHFELNYQNFKIYVKNYEEVMCVLITSQNPSEDVKVASNMFIKTFYKQFQDNVKSFDGNLKIFQTANEHVEQYFELQLTYPHIVNPLFKGRVRRLNNLEMVIYRAATAIFVQNRYFFIPTLIEMVESVRKEPRSQLLHTLYQMRLDKIFEPISFDEAHRILSEEKEQVSTLKKIDDALGEIK